MRCNMVNATSLKLSCDNAKITEKWNKYQMDNVIKMVLFAPHLTNTNSGERAKVLYYFPMRIGIQKIEQRIIKSQYVFRLASPVDPDHDDPNGDSGDSVTSKFVQQSERSAKAWKKLWPMDNSLRLSMEEAIYLNAEVGVLEIFTDDRQECIPDVVWKKFYDCYGIRFVKRYAAYRYFRRQGWVVRPGLHCGSIDSINCISIIYVTSLTWKTSDDRVKYVKAICFQPSDSAFMCYIRLTVYTGCSCSPYHILNAGKLLCF
ncbi:tRNA-splicing endonuclease subunit [Dirofilaria immitis]